VRRPTGADAEEILWAYPRLPFFEPGALADHLDRFERHPPLVRDVLVVRLANELEDRLDGALSYTRAGGARRFAAAEGERMLALARRLGLSALADDLDEAFRRDASWSPPEGLVGSRAFAYELPARRLWASGRLRRGAARLRDGLRRTLPRRPL
jgi:hypothetical protein